jgi:uncharacterized protein YxeA
MKKALMIVAIVALVAIAGSAVYYFVFYKPEIARTEIRLQEEKIQYDKEQKAIEQKAIEQEKKDKEEADANKKMALAKALDNLNKQYEEGKVNAYKNYIDEWNRNCASRGLAPGSNLPSDLATALQKNYDNNLAFLAKEYQSNKDDIYKLFD